jgi:uncharacterized protein (DUF1778 family)
MTESSRAMNLRFKDPDQHERIKAAARAAGVSVQDFVLDAAMRRALAVQDRFVEAALAAFNDTAATWAELDPEDAVPDEDLAARERHAARALTESEGGRAA